MKKISYLETSCLLITILITFNSGINLYILKINSSIDSWIAIILSYILGIIPLSMILYISDYKKELNIFEKINNLFKNPLNKIINIIICIVLFIIGITILYNIVSFINTQFLYHTPLFISSLLLISLAIYCSIKGINVITHVNFILITISLIIFLISTPSLISNIIPSNLLPILKTPTKGIILSTIYLMIINILPIIIILIIPKDTITNQFKYHKSIIISYIIGSLISIFITTSTLSILGIYLTKTFEYPEYMVLKKIKLFGFLERVENIISTEWITETFIYLTLIIYSISTYLTKNNNHKKNIYNNIIIGLLITITSQLIFKNITIFNNYLETIFIYLLSPLIIIYIIIMLKIFFSNLHLSK